MKIYRIIIVCSCFLVIGQASVQQPIVTNKLGMQFVLIKPGQTTIGKFQPTVGKLNFQGKPFPKKINDDVAVLSQKDALPGFTVKINKEFYIGKFEVTQEQWKKLMGNNPSVFKNDSSANKPVENIDWNDAQAFLKKLNALDKVYFYRLPTEFEWEYAARAGAQDDISWNDIRASAVLGADAPAKGGTKKPNAWGLYDMLGNVWEWVQDFYNEKIFADRIPPATGQQHVLKGASFTGDVKNATYMTHAGGPGNGFDIGLRLVMQKRKNKL